MLRAPGSAPVGKRLLEVVLGELGRVLGPLHLDQADLWPEHVDEAALGQLELELNTGRMPFRSVAGEQFGQERFVDRLLGAGEVTPLLREGFEPRPDLLRRHSHRVAR